MLLRFPVLERDNGINVPKHCGSRNSTKIQLADASFEMMMMTIGLFRLGIFLSCKVHDTVRLTSTGNPVPGKREFRLAPTKTIVEQVKKISSVTQGIDRGRRSGEMRSRSFVHFT